MTENRARHDARGSEPAPQNGPQGRFVLLFFVLWNCPTATKNLKKLLLSFIYSS